MARDLSPILPSSFQVRFRVRRCSGSVADLPNIPDYYESHVSLDDLDQIDPAPQGNGFPLTLRSSALALWDVHTVTITNQSTLDALAKKMAQDHYNWQSGPRFDRLYNGVVVPQANGIADFVEITHELYEDSWQGKPTGQLLDRIVTRYRTAEWNDFPTDFQQNDGPNNAACKDDPGSPPAFVVGKDPCIEVYDSFFARNGHLWGHAKKFCLEAGRLTETYLRDDDFGCWPCGAPCNTTPQLCVIISDQCNLNNGSPPPVFTGSTVTITRASDGWKATCTIGQVTGFPWSYRCCVDLPVEGGTYKVDIVTPFGPCSVPTLELARCQSSSVGSFLRPASGAFGCLGNPIQGAKITFAGPCGGSTVTTGSDGKTCFDNISYTGAGATYTFSKPPRWQDVTHNADGLYYFNAGIILPANGYTCSCACNEPVSQVLELVDPWGTTRLTYAPSPVPVLYGNRATECPSGGAWLGMSGYNGGPTALCPGATGPLVYILQNGGFSTCGGGSSPGCLQLLGTLTTGVDQVFSLQGFVTSVQCPDSATGSVLLWQGTYQLCGDNIPFTITEIPPP